MQGEGSDKNSEVWVYDDTDSKTRSDSLPYVYQKHDVRATRNEVKILSSSMCMMNDVFV